MTIAEIIHAIIRREGGYSDRVADKGGPTNWGITQTTLAAWRGVPVTAEDVKNLSYGEAEQIYEKRYVAPWSFVFHLGLRTVLIDWGVTSGLDDPTKALQRYLGVTVDGALGPKTRAAWAKFESEAQPSPVDDVARVIAKDRVKFYVQLALDAQAREFMKAHPSTQLHNLAGWVNRGLEFL